MNALHVITCKYVGPRGLTGSRVVLRSDRFKQTKSMPKDCSMRDSLDQGWKYLKDQGFKPIGTGEGRACMYIVCEVIKPLKDA
jgi:hypothetical protein